MQLKALYSWQKALILGTVFIVSAATLFLTAEGVVRVRHYLRYGGLWGIEDTYTVDPQSGLRIPIPGSHVGSIVINSQGFRSPALNIKKRESTVRLAFLGGSTTYCAEVSSNELTWPYLVNEALKAHYPEANFDYINGGVPGYGVPQSLINLRERIRKYRPDIIFIYNATNDLSANSYDLAREQNLVQKRTEQTLSWPANYSLLWYLAEKNLKIRLLEAKANNKHEKLNYSADKLARPFRTQLYELVKESQNTAELVALITFSTQLRREQAAEQRSRAAATSLYYMPYMSIDGILEGFDIYNNVIREVAKDTGAYLIGNENAIPGDAVHFNDSVHFTDAGSKAMAERIIHALIESGIVEKIMDRRQHGVD